MRQTKIIATLGPASSSPEVIDALLAAGVDIFRLNFSHGTHDSHAEVYRRVRDAAARRGCIVAVMQDLSGPKIRTGPLRGRHDAHCCSEGEELRIAAGDERRARRTDLHAVRASSFDRRSPAIGCCSTTGGSSCG